jgi:hypothetical protein
LPDGGLPTDHSVMDQPSDCQSSPQSGMSHEESLERPDAWADTTNKKAGSLKMNPLGTEVSA